METATKTLWVIDPSHSEIHFKVKHMMVSTVTGAFQEFEGSLETENEDFENAQIHFSAQVDSINTNNQQRDQHLKSDDFFNAEEFPQLTFKSKSLSKTQDDWYELKGDLTIRNQTQEVSLEVEHHGTALDPYGQIKAGFEIRGKISRKAFGLTWNAVTEAGQVVVSDEVRLALNVQLIKQ